MVSVPRVNTGGRSFKTVVRTTWLGRPEVPGKDSSYAFEI